MFCHECGREVREGDKYCPRCGADVHAQTQPSSRGKSRLTIALRLALMACVTVVPWFDFNYYVGRMSFNFLSLGGAASTGVRALQSISLVSGTSVDTGAINALSLFCTALALVPVVCLALDIRTYLKKGLLRWYGPIAVIVILVLGLVAATLISQGISASVSDGLSSSIQLDMVSVGAGWWATLALAAVTIWVDRLVRAGKCVY